MLETYVVWVRKSLLERLETAYVLLYNYDRVPWRGHGETPTRKRRPLVSGRHLEYIINKSTKRWPIKIQSILKIPDVVPSPTPPWCWLPFFTEELGIILGLRLWRTPRRCSTYTTRRRDRTPSRWPYVAYYIKPICQGFRYQNVLREVSIIMLYLSAN